MARTRDEDMLEPILPKHPPTEREAAAADESVAVGAARVRPSWDRIVLVGCAVVATLALVIVAVRTSSIAEDQRVQTCQVRVYAAQQHGFGNGGRETQQRLAAELAKCVGAETDADEGSD